MNVYRASKPKHVFCYVAYFQKVDKEDGLEVVKMHDVVRDVAVYIASEESTQKKNNDGLKKRIVLRQNVELNGWSTNEDTICTSLATGGLTDLLLFVPTGDGTKLKLPATIFKGMEDLKVLVIEGSALTSLPLLKNLQTLILGDCHLNFDAIGELRTLMILWLSESDIQQLPDTFKNLSNLRMLDLRECDKLKTIAPGVISSLSRLEELYLWDSFQDWVVEKLASAETTNWISQLEGRGQPEEEVHMWKRLNRLAVDSASQLEDEERSEPEDVVDLGKLYRKEVKNSNRKDEHTKWANSMDWRVGILAELLSLSRLTTLQVVLPPVDILLGTSCKLFHKLQRFKISIGWDEDKSMEDLKDYDNYLRVADLDASSLAGTGISLLLKKTNALELKLKNLTDPLDVLDCANLESLELEDCDALEYLIDMTSLTEHAPRSVGGSRLKELQKLKRLAILGCQSLESIFGLKGSGHHEETHLTLTNLPSFTSISNSNCLTVEHQLFFDPKVYFPVLRSLTIHGLDNLKEIWNCQLSPNSFCELTDLDVSNCDKLLHLVPTHMQNRLQKLGTIRVWNCSSLEEVFEVRRSTVNEGDASTISQSKIIHSSISQPDQGMQVNNIMDFKQSRQGFQNLTSLLVTSCHSLRYLLSPSIARGLVRLESLHITECEKIEEIVAADEGEEKEEGSILPRLTDLQLWGLPNLGSFSQGKYTLEWPLLGEIYILNCSKMNNFCSGSLSIPREVDIAVWYSGENLKQELGNCRKEM